MKFSLYITMLLTVLLPLKGVTLFQHFCGGDLVSFELYEKQNKPCCDDHGHDEPCSDCEDLETILSLDDFQKAESTFSFSFHVVIDMVEASAFNTLYTFELDNSSSSPSNTPPVWSGRHRSILHQSFLL